MIDLKIVIPSRGRADRVLAKNAVVDPIICVRASSADEYREHNPEVEVVAHPDEVEDRSFTAKLQWILDHFGNVMYLDDDSEYMLRLYAPKGARAAAKMTAEEATAIVHSTYLAAQDIGAYYWGFNTQVNPLAFSGHVPIKVSGMCWGNGCGIRYADDGCKLFWEPTIRTNNDYWMALLNAHHHRYAYFDHRFVFLAKGTFNTPGGASAYRTEAVEKTAYEKLKMYFGERITLKKDAPLAKRKHRYQPQINLPF